MNKGLSIKAVLFPVFCLLATGFSQPPSGGGTPFYHQNRTVIPFKLEGHKIYVQVYIKNSSRPSWFILDTGAFTSIGDPLMKRFNFSKDKTLRASGDIKFAYTIREKVTVQVGQIGVNDFRLVYMDHSFFYQTDPQLQGFLGSDFLRFFYVKIDYQRKELTLSRDPFPVPRISGTSRIRMNTGNPAFLPEIDCRIDKRWSWSGLIDTGAPFAFVFPIAALSHQKSAGQPVIESNGIMLSWPTSKIDKNYLSRVDHLKLGELELTDLPVIFANTEDIILGESFLSQFQIYLNYPENEIVMVPQGSLNWKSNFFSIGVKLMRSADRQLIIDAIWRSSPADKAGLTVGMEVLDINGQKTDQMQDQQWISLLNNDRIHTIELILRDGYREKNIQLKKVPLLPVN
jgi:hypothetical protein